MIGSHHVGHRTEINRPKKSSLAGLTEHAERTGTHLGLTPKGFEVIHEEELNQNQIRTNIGIGILTIFLVTGSLLQGYSAYLTHNDIFDQLILFVVVVVSVLIGLFVISIMMGKNLIEYLPSV
ncbi:hypothetical protein [Halorubrum halophilum]|uniref:hypothetical protein n=1 Tax=Halorubrum halophilum TaxID=413816 RepID=UPI0012AB7558|nr:hypothetical protein [Halorubrum halophilum]